MKKNILLFFPDCTLNDYNGAGIYLQNIIKFIDKYYNCNIYCLIGRYNINYSRWKNYVSDYKFKNTVKFIHGEHLGFNIKSLFFNWKSYMCSNIAQGSRYYNIWLTVINICIKKYNIDYTIIRHAQLQNRGRLKHGNKLIPNLYLILIPPPKFDLEFAHIKKESTYTNIYISPNDYQQDPNSIYLPPMIMNNITYPFVNLSDNLNIVSFTGTFTDYQNILECFLVFDNCISKNVLPNNFILNITGKNCFSDSYFSNLMNKIKNLKNKGNFKYEFNEKGVDGDKIKDIIIKSVVCIRLDAIREVISTKLLNYIDLNKPVIVQNLKTHKYILGDNYPFLIDINKNIVLELINVFKKLNKETIKKAYDMVCYSKYKVCDENIYALNKNLKKMFT